MEAAAKTPVNRRSWFDYVLIAIRTAWFVTGMNHIISNPDRYAYGENLMGAAGILWAILLWFTAIYVVPMVLFLTMNKKPIYTIISEIALTGAFYCFLESNAGGSFAVFNFPMLVLGYVSKTRGPILLSLVTAVGLPFLASWLWGIGYSAVFEKMLDLLVLFAIGFCFQKMNHMYGVIKEQNRTLEQYAKQIEKLTLTEERNRLSRELHDTVGLTFTTTITGMDAVYYLIDADPKEAKRTLRELLMVTRSGFDEVRYHIHQIASSSEEPSLSQALADIGRTFAAHSGTAVKLHISGEEVEVSEAVRITLIRCLQESLTNAKKHGKAASIEVKLDFLSGQARLSVRDDGRGTDNLAAGFGLKAMENRIANLHGRLSVTSALHRGTTILCELPIGR